MLSNGFQLPSPRLIFHVFGKGGEGYRIVGSGRDSAHAQTYGLGAVFGGKGLFDFAAQARASGQRRPGRLLCFRSRLVRAGAKEFRAAMLD